jgi:hypothetical protein
MTENTNSHLQLINVFILGFSNELFVATSHSPLTSTCFMLAWTYDLNSMPIYNTEYVERSFDRKYYFAQTFIFYRQQIQLVISITWVKICLGSRINVLSQHPVALV